VKSEIKNPRNFYNTVIFSKKVKAQEKNTNNQKKIKANDFYHFISLEKSATEPVCCCGLARMVTFLQ